MFSFFLATEYFFMATILQLKVTKRQPFEKVSLERCLQRNIYTAKIMSYRVFDRSHYARGKGIVDYEGREWHE